MNLQNKLEEIKQSGAYSIVITFGEGLGCDDLDVPMLERIVQVWWSPVGYLGEVKVLWKGKLLDFLLCDLRAVPIRISNPPREGEIKHSGYYVWGVNESVERYKVSKYP